MKGLVDYFILCLFTEKSDKITTKHYTLVKNLTLVFAFMNRNWFLLSSIASNWRSDFNACENFLFIIEIIKAKSLLPYMQNFYFWWYKLRFLLDFPMSLAHDREKKVNWHLSF